MTPEEQRAFIVQQLLAGNPQMRGYTPTGTVAPRLPRDPTISPDPMASVARNPVIAGDPEANANFAGAVAWPAKALIAALERDVANQRNLAADVKSDTGATMVGGPLVGADMMATAAAPIVARALRAAAKATPAAEAPGKVAQALRTAPSNATLAEARAAAPTAEELGAPISAPMIMKRFEPKVGDIIDPQKYNLFDYSKLVAPPMREAVDLPRKLPKYGPPEPVVRALTNPDVIKSMEAGIDAGIGKGAHWWYQTLPLYEKFMERVGGNAGARNFFDSMRFNERTSPLSSVPENIKNASLYNALHRAGVDISTFPQPGRGSGYGSIAGKNHWQNSLDYQRGVPDPFPLKPPSYGDNLLGNWAPVAVDNHAFRAPAIASRDPYFLVDAIRQPIRGINPKTGKMGPVPDPHRPGKFLYENIPVKKAFERGEMGTMDDLLKQDRPKLWRSVPNENEYPYFEQFYKLLGARKGLYPAQAQSSPWVGMADVTGQSSGSLPYVAMVEDAIKQSAAEKGIPVLRELDNYLLGREPLGVYPREWQKYFNGPR